MNKKAFTLLELLVVVLIIGILAAIALPQYQLAVDKSKFAGYQTLAKNLAEAYQRYRLTHDDAPQDLDDLDIDLPTGYTKTSPTKQSCAVFGDTYCCISYPELGYQAGISVCGHKDNSVAMVLTIIASNNITDSSRKYCYAKTDNARAMKLCKSLPHTTTDSTNLATQSGHKTGYTRYRLN